MKKTTVRGAKGKSDKSTLSYIEIMDFLEEELANSQLEDTDDDDLSPLNFDEANRK